MVDLLSSNGDCLVQIICTGGSVSSFENVTANCSTKNPWRERLYLLILGASKNYVHQGPYGLQNHIGILLKYRQRTTETEEAPKQNYKRLSQTSKRVRKYKWSTKKIEIERST